MRDSDLPTSSHAMTVSIKLDGTALPVDHQYDLGEELLRLAPQLRDDPFGGVHSIQVAASQNGWCRPDGLSESLQLSKRTRLVVRCSPSQLGVLSELSGQQLMLGDCTIRLGDAAAKPITASRTLFVRNIRFSHSSDAATESLRQQLILDEAQALGVTTLSLIFGSESQVNQGKSGVLTHNLLIADLSATDSLTLQEQGLGIDQLFGCGLPIPYKSISPVSD